MVALGRIPRLYVIILVVWFGRTANLEKSFKLFRGYHDVFSNLECLPAGDSSGSSSCSELLCSGFGAKCFERSMDCSYCVCNKNNKNTYIEDGQDKRCMNDENIARKFSDCYKFKDNTVLQFFSHDNCGGSCSRYFKSNKNANCKIDWSESKYWRHGKAWNPVMGEKTYFSVKSITGKSKTNLTVNDNALKKWNGSLIKLEMKTSGKQQNKKHSCLLLKFESLPKYSQVTPTSSTWPTASSTNQHTTLSSKSDLSIESSSTEAIAISIPIKVTPTSSTWPPASSTNHHTTLSSKSDLRIESSSTKAIAISIPIIIVIILCLVLVFFFIRMQRRAQELRTNEEEMQSYQDPSQIYQTEQPYQGLEKGVTNPCVGPEGEYSYASNNNLIRPATASQPPPSAPVVDQTLDCDRFTDKEQDSKKEAFDQQPQNHIYQNYDELSYKSLDPTVDQPLNQRSQNPFNQTLEEQQAVGNPKLNLGEELRDKSLDSAVEEEIDKPSQNPVNQMVENDPNAGQDDSSEAFGYPSVGDVPANDPVYHVLDNP